MRKKTIKILISIFIIYHLVAIVVFPNPSSILARSLAPLINSYGNTLGLNTTWQFFSPDPAHLRFIHYQVVTEKDDDIEIQDFFWPPKKTSGYFKANIGRRFYHSFRMIISERNREKYLIPFFCRQHLGATSIVIKAVSKIIPPIEVAQLKGIDKFEEIRETINVPSQEYACIRGEG